MSRRTTQISPKLGTSLPKRKKTRAAKRKIVPRDSGLCGIHSGGCGQALTTNCTVDHIVPLSLAKSVAPNPREFDQPWNYQPMHQECNKRKDDETGNRELGEFETIAIARTNTPDHWPRFQCKCHYLQILEGDLYVCTKEPIGPNHHKLYEGVVKDFGGENRQDAIMVMGRWTGPGGKQMAGFSNLDKTQRGYMLSSFSPKAVPGFNIAERSRVGLATPKYIYVDEKGHVTPVTPGSPLYAQTQRNRSRHSPRSRPEGPT